MSEKLLITWPAMAEGQIGWYIDSPYNRLIVGDNWIARDWFPALIIPDDEPPAERE